MKKTILLFLVVSAVAIGAIAQANHRWWSYHWADTSERLTVVDSVERRWNKKLASAVSQWSAPAELDLAITAGSARKAVRSRCEPAEGTIRVCNGKYGQNGWLGITEIWTDGDHIRKARVKLNDSYLKTGPYADNDVRRHVVCQELGHALGLDHQYAASCMNDRDGLFDKRFVGPNTHDLEQLSQIYAHTGDGAGEETNVSAPQKVTWTFVPVTR